MKSMDDLNVGRRICLGDAVGYGPSPNECVRIIREQSAVTLLGNHDSVALGRETSENFNLYARKAIEWTREVLEPDVRKFLEALPFRTNDRHHCARCDQRRGFLPDTPVKWQGEVLDNNQYPFTLKTTRALNGGGSQIGLLNRRFAV